MTTQTEPMTPEEKRARRAEAERERRARKKREQEEAAQMTPSEALLAAAQAVAPDIKSRYRPRDIEALEEIVGGEDPVAFAFEGVPEGALGRRAARKTLVAWTRGELEATDPAAIHLRAMARRVSRDERAPRIGKDARRDLWGRKVGALLVALADRS